MALKIPAANSVEFLDENTSTFFARKKILLNRGWLTTQTTDFSSALLEVTQRREFQAGQSIFFEGDEMDGLDGIVSGWVGVYSSSFPFLSLTDELDIGNRNFYLPRKITASHRL